MICNFRPFDRYKIMERMHSRTMNGREYAKITFCNSNMNALHLFVDKCMHICIGWCEISWITGKEAQWSDDDAIKL